ncbi:MAG TPA: hypothetical protein VNU66_05410 [Mycobacteriales bacterium]|nr:hypothetical protein [Mycobacteriales bacterium]
MPDAGVPARAAGAALLASAVLALAFFAALVANDRGAVTGLLILFALVTVPALLSAVLGVPAAVRMLLGRGAERAAVTYSGLLALGHAGVVLLSLRPGLDRRLDDGDLLGAAAGGAGLLSGLLAGALLLPLAADRAARTPVRLRAVAALSAGAVVLALLGLRAASALD